MPRKPQQTLVTGTSMIARLYGTLVEPDGNQGTVHGEEVVLGIPLVVPVVVTLTPFKLAGLLGL